MCRIILPVVLVAVTLANPITCQMFGGAEAAADKTHKMHDHAPSHCATPCAGDRDDSCRGEHRTIPSGGRSSSEPCDCPGGFLCQCLCAGALVKIAATAEPDEELAATGNAEVSMPAGQTPESKSRGREEVFLFGGANAGRATRCLRCSWLC